MPRENENQNLTDGLVYVGLNEIEALIDRMILLGSPGIGKTEKIRQLAEKEAEAKGRKFIDLRSADAETIRKIMENPEKYYVFLRIVASHIMPEDLSVPRFLSNNSHNFVEFIPPKILYIMTMPNIEGVLFIDEITNVSRPDQMSVLFSLIYEKEVSWGVKLNDGIKIIMAGNLPKSSSIANLLPDPLVSRSILFYVKPPTVDEWVSYMYNNYGEHWETIIGSFLLYYPQFLYFDKYNLDNNDDDSNDNRRLYEEYVGSGERLLNFATPRTWTNLSLRLYELKQRGISYKSSFVRALVFGSLGPYVSNHIYPILAKELDIERILKELNDNPSVIKMYDATTKIIAASFLFGREISEEALRELVNIDKEFLTIAVLSQPMQKRVLIAQKYPWLISKLASNLAKYSNASRVLKDVNRDMNVSLV